MSARSTKIIIQNQNSSTKRNYAYYKELLAKAVKKDFEIKIQADIVIADQ